MQRQSERPVIDEQKQKIKRQLNKKKNIWCNYFQWLEMVPFDLETKIQGEGNVEQVLVVSIYGPDNLRHVNLYHYFFMKRC